MKGAEHAGSGGTDKHFFEKNSMIRQAGLPFAISSAARFFRCVVILLPRPLVYFLCAISAASLRGEISETGKVSPPSDFAWWPKEISLRGGFSATRTHQNFQTYLLGTGWDFPLAEEKTGPWRIEARLDASLGTLHNPDDTAALLAFGPAMHIRHRDFPLRLDVSCCPTLLSDHHFGPVDFGVGLQFTSSIGLTWQISPQWEVGYRFQHMSNASLSKNNPGLELHQFSVGFHF